MKIGVAVIVGCLIQVPGYACELGQDQSCKDAATPFAGRHPVHALSIRELLRPATDRRLLTAEIPDQRARLAGGPVYESTFARAIARAAKRSAAELAIEAATKIIVMCQKERNPALTTPFFRSDSQQAHCFRY
ncbi:hypothetical protein [Massilia niabensis]|uniref:Lipoprotein n=1 Tax=Massilia niabensis TaxID=544910 RepID=A0ABW0L8A6_9BURK